MADIPFKISSGLKNIIGKELITDEFVAVFELVKNSFDADAEKVEIIFENQTDLSKGKIIIKDNGKGMNEVDLKNKWLFVAYSAKKEGTENEEDYRNKIRHNRYFAGAKGVGRFSCDRLGKKLKLITVKDEKNSQIQSLEVNWQKFEDKPLTEFKDVNVVYKTLGKSNEKGTKLEITGLRDVWDRKKLLKLKGSLAKLINPNQGNDNNSFQIEIVAKSESLADKKTSTEYEKVNGLIGNDVFENLKIKTTSLKVDISSDGKTITSVLQDRGDRIYTLIEKNLYSELNSISSYLFQLNFNAKVAFKNAMGVRSVDYGTVFMYKNGFRVYPFGEPGEDLLLIDRRKAQGYNRFLGNRDIIGRIEINGKQEELRETSSRDGGLVKTATYYQLVKFFEEFVLKRLENYVVNVIKWGDERIDEETGEVIQPELLAKDVKIQILELITGFIKSDNIIDIDYDKNFLRIIESKQDKSVDKIIKNISNIAAKSNNPAIVKEAARIGKAVKEVKEDAAKDKARADKAEEAAAKTQDVLKHTIGQNSFLKDSVKADTKELQSLLHHTEKATYWINKHLENLIKGIEKNEPKEKLFQIISSVSLENQKIFSFTKYHKSTKFNTFVKTINQDIISFTNEYISNVCKFYDDYEGMNIQIKNFSGVSFVRDFAPIEIPIIIDNLLNNSKTAKAKNIDFEWVQISPKEVVLYVSDDGNNGKAIDSSFADKIFDFRFTTTKGSGLGLYHVKSVLNKMNGDIIINKKYSKGAGFTVFFKK
jgi:hypothetical protein